MPTWQCTAACTDCGTFSNPRNKVRLDVEDLEAAIDQAHAQGYQVVVFTGGEATLRWEPLITCIQRAERLGLPTRLVTNGWWGKAAAIALERMRELKRAGLREINFSTGDQHARYISLDVLANSVEAAIIEGYDVHIMVEVRAQSILTKEKILSHEKFLRFSECSKISFVESPWMPTDFRELRDYPPDSVFSKNNVWKRGGCSSIFETITVQANGKVGVCCGIGSSQVAALQLGSFDRSANTLEDLYRHAESDFIKILIRQIGPENLLARLAELEQGLEWEDLYAHKCHACIRVFSDTKILELVEKHKDLLLIEVATSLALRSL